MSDDHIMITYFILASNFLFTRININKCHYNILFWGIKVYKYEFKAFQDDAATWVFYTNTFDLIFCTPWSDLGVIGSACWLYLKHAPTSVFLNNFCGSTTATSVAEFYLWDRTDASSTWKLKDYYFFNDAATEVVYLAGRLV